MQHLVFVDVEAAGASPVNGTMTEFGCVHEPSGKTFHGILYEATPDPTNPAKPIVGAMVATQSEVAWDLIKWLEEVCEGGRPVFVSDNPAYDFMWIAGMYDTVSYTNPFGHSGRRISDYYAGLKQDWRNTQGWKKYRETVHDHNPVNDSMGNVEAFRKLMALEKELRDASKGHK